MSVDLISEYETYLRYELDRADSTIDLYISTVLRRMDEELTHGLLSATEDELKGWLLRKTWGKSTRHTYRAAIAGFFAFACDPRRSPRLDFNPAAYLPGVKVPQRYPRPAPTSVVHDVLKRSTGRRKAIFLVASCAGARCVEIAALDREDVGEESTLLHGKGDKMRSVPTHPLLWAWVQDLPSGPVVRGRFGGRMTRNRVSGVGSEGLTALGYPSITMHMIRHWFATEAFNEVLDLRVVQELLGHASIATTQVYVQASRRRMEAAVKGLPGLDQAA